MWQRESAVSRNTIVSRQLCRLGIAAMERDKWDNAGPLLAKAVDVCPEDADARSKYADFLWRKGQQGDAIAQMSEAIRLAPDNAALRVTYGEMQLAAGDLEAAGEAADLALDLEPKSPDAWALRGRLMRRSGKLTAALSDLHHAESLEPANTSYPAEIAEVYLALDKPDRALATLQSLGDRWSAPDEPAFVLVLKGRAYMGTGRYANAADSFQLALNRGAGNSQTFYWLAEAQLRAGRPREAATAARRALSLDPQHGPSRYLLAQLGVAGDTVRR